MRCFTALEVPTRLSRDDLTNIVIVRAVDVRKQRREARNGDVLREQVELGDSVPDLSLWSKLSTECEQTSLHHVRRFQKLTISMSSTLGLMS